MSWAGSEEAIVRREARYVQVCDGLDSGLDGHHQHPFALTRIIFPRLTETSASFLNCHLDPEEPQYTLRPVMPRLCRNLYKHVSLDRSSFSSLRCPRT